MLKPQDTWNWFFDERENALMLDLGSDMLFRANLPKKLLVDCAFYEADFSVDDASAFQIFKGKASRFELSEARQAELALNCVAAKRFHKPVQPKSWFFEPQGDDHYCPDEGDIVHLKNQYGEGCFMVIEVCENASLCALIEPEEFVLDGNKELRFGEAIKVMHNRMICANQTFGVVPVALVG